MASEYGLGVPTELLSAVVDHVDRDQVTPSCSDPGAQKEEICVSASKPDTLLADGLTCAICLDHIDPANLALIPECEHQYCASCILHWAVHKEASWCPQCRLPFSQLQTYRALDGTLRDQPSIESVCLLKRTEWFQQYLQAREKGKAPAPNLAAGEASIPAEVMDWQDYGRFYDEYDDDEEVEAYYFSSAAGRARITLGNRRWGENGYVSSGRMQARPVAPARPAKAGKAGKDSPASAGAKPATPARLSPAAGPCTPPARPKPSVTSQSSASEHSLKEQQPCPSQRKPAGPSPGASHGASDKGSGDGKGGRRARRNARRAAQDARAGCELYE